MNNKTEKLNEIKFTFDNWRTYPYNQLAFSNVKKILPTAIIDKGIKESDIKSDLENINALTFTNKYKEKSNILNFLEKNLADSFVVIKKGKKIFEWFKNHQNPISIDFNVDTKSISITYAIRHKILDARY